MLETLKKLLGIVRDATGIEPVPFQTESYKDALPALTYSFYCSTDDGAKAHYRFLTRVHAKNYQECLEISEKLSSALVTLGDETLEGLVIAGNGGGSLVDTETGIPQQINYYDIKARS